jgi:hypothetical protein
MNSPQRPSSLRDLWQMFEIGPEEVTPELSVGVYTEELIGLH